MAKTNRICKTCGKAYYYCPTCDIKKPNWFAMWDSEKCKDIFMILSKESVKHIPVEEIKKELDELHVSLDDMFTESVKKHIARIYKECETKSDKFEELEQFTNFEVNTAEQLEETVIVINDIQMNTEVTIPVIKKKRKLRISEEIE